MTLARPCTAYEVDPLECDNCGSIIKLIDSVEVVERILPHLNRWNPQPDTSPLGDPESPPP